MCRYKVMAASLFCWGLLFAPQQGLCEMTSITEPGILLFQIQQGEHARALKSYQEAFKQSGKHDYELLHKIGLALLDHGFRQRDPESKVFALFGASVSAHEDAYYILEESYQSKYPQVQLVALQALARYQTDRADQVIMRALGSPLVELRFEAAKLLCQKKHPQAVVQTESLMYKVTKSAWPLFAPLFAMVGDVPSTRILRKLLNQPSQNLHLAIILSIAKYERDDLLPQVRQLSTHHNYALQEACAFALGHLNDGESIPKLEKMAASQHPYVALAAQAALYKLGKKEHLDGIELFAQTGDLFAIAALGKIPEHPRVLLQLARNNDLQIRLNAVISLLNQQHPQAYDLLDEFLIRDRRDLAFSEQNSPGKALKYWKATPSSSQVFKEDISAYSENLEFKEEILTEIRKQSTSRFIDFAHKIFQRQQNDLIPITVELLEDMGSDEAIQCLKQHQQQLGAPLVRNYCNLALYRLNEQGPYGEQLRQWVIAQSKTQLIEFKPFDPWELGKSAYVLTPEETSKLLIDAFQSFAENQDPMGIEALIEAIANGNPKSRYALAGLLLRATQ